MSRWRYHAVRLFPEYLFGAGSFQRSDMTLWQIFFDLEMELDERIEAGDRDWIGRVMEFVKWCYKQRNRAPDVWNAAAAAFLEHMADNDSRAALIPEHVSPEMFEEMWSLFERLRELDGEGKSRSLLDAYNARNGTQFRRDRENET